MKPSSSKDFFMEELERKNDKLYLILRGHLYIENELNKLLEGFIPNPEILELYKRSFYNKIELALSLNLIELEHSEALLAFNELRNKYAHRLKYRISHQEIMYLKELVGKIDGLQVFNEGITINNKSNSLIDIKSIIIALRVVLRERANTIIKCENPTFDLEK
ncbi:hypothetical protein [Priestia megaterium]|uniref:hypothetical protein n=1 Tax=Priestia megaterium TaxID=1404 RepID=UPI002E1FC5BA|nr:hypothetical protein [Priestia megaterium]